MASAQRQASPDLVEVQMQRHLARDDFFQLVRWLERLGKLQCRDSGRQAAPIGGDGPPAGEAVRFRAVNHLAFPGRAIERAHRIGGEGEQPHARFELDVSFMGLNGPTGVLPRHYTALIQERLRQRDPALADFLDIFNHRLIALFYRAWAKYRLTVQHEDALGVGRPDSFGRALQGFAGQPTARVYPTQLYYAGHFARHTRSAGALQQILEDLLQSPVRIRSFIGQWLPIQPQDRLLIGSGDRGRNNRLGDGVLLGRRVWDVQSKFGILIGPVTQSRYEELAGDTPAARALHRLIESYVPAHLEVELQFLIQDGARRPRRLGERPRLGRNAWLQSVAHRPLRAKQRLRRGSEM